MKQCFQTIFLELFEYSMPLLLILVKKFCESFGLNFPYESSKPKNACLPSIAMCQADDCKLANLLFWNTILASIVCNSSSQAIDQSCYREKLCSSFEVPWYLSLMACTGSCSKWCFSWLKTKAVVLHDCRQFVSKECLQFWALPSLSVWMGEGTCYTTTVWEGQQSRPLPGQACPEIGIIYGCKGWMLRLLAEN